MKKNYIPLCMLFGIALGNSIGLVIGISFFMENIGIGLLIGNTTGISIGLLVGTLLNFKKK